MKSVKFVLSAFAFTLAIAMAFAFKPAENTMLVDASFNGSSCITGLQTQTGCHDFVSGETQCTITTSGQYNGNDASSTDCSVLLTRTP